MENDMKQLNVNAENGSFSFSLVDQEARDAAAEALQAAQNSGGPIQYIESLDQSNLVNLRDLATGSYVLYGYFKPFAGYPSTLTFDKLIVNVVSKTAGTHVLIFSTLNSVVNFLSILVDSTKELGFTYERTNISMLDLYALIAKVGTLTNLTTEDQSSLVAAINEVAAKATQGGGSVRVAYIDLLAANWEGNTSPYSQVVAIDGVTEFSQVNLTPSVEQLVIFHDIDLTFVTENENGVVTVYAIGDKPTNDYTIQVSIMEVTA